MCDWMSARAWPACQVHKTSQGDKLVVLGGDIKAMSTQNTATGTCTGVMFHLAPSPSNKALQQAAEADLKTRLKRADGDQNPRHSPEKEATDPLQCLHKGSHSQSFRIDFEKSSI